MKALDSHHDGDRSFSIAKRRQEGPLDVFAMRPKSQTLCC
jgi:hypothetical protein